MSVNSQGGNDQFLAFLPMRQGTYLPIAKLVRPDVLAFPTYSSQYVHVVSLGSLMCCEELSNLCR